jgi:hypothetical protein
MFTILCAVSIFSLNGKLVNGSVANKHKAAGIK